MTHYEVLGVAETASAEEVRAAYRAAARRLHPDVADTADATGKGGTGTDMQTLNEAWRVLRDPGRRAAYDRILHEPVREHDPIEASDDMIDLIRDLQDDDPIGPVRSAEGWWAMAPNVALVVAIGLLVGAILFASPALLVFAGGAFFATVGLYILVPLRAMTRPR